MWLFSNQSLQALVELMQNRKLTLGFAESCTGGSLSAALTKIPGVSLFFQGSIVTYSNTAKVDLLGVSRDTLKNEGAVSDEVARQMAQGARNKLNCDWAVAVTGIAGPSGGSVEKPVGTVWFAVAGPNFVTSQKMKFSGGRAKIQQRSVEFAIEFLLNSMKKALNNN